jgi:DMSO/TMAO reductase YedYZ molybdopterin-dependent catalytic subunit
VHRIVRACIPILLPVVLAQLLLLAPKTCAQTTATTADLRIGGAVSTPLVLTIVDLKKMHRKTLAVVNPHDKKKETYEGVLLEEILQRAGVPQADQLRGSSMATSPVSI